MQYFDLHCDTLYKAVTENSSLCNPLYEVTAEEGKKFQKWCQCFAVWIPDDVSDLSAEVLFKQAYNKLVTEAKLHNANIFDGDFSKSEYNFIFTVENAKLISNDLDKIDTLCNCGVKMVTLTWNAENSIGGGSQAQYMGLTEFGKKCVTKLESKNIAVDLSHASDKTFYDVLSISQKPVAASHSNSRSVCPHIRNLTNEQFSEIVRRRGVVGLNFHKEFLSSKSDDASVADVLKHAEHFLSLGGENALCIGSDFDGSDIPKDLNNIRKIPDLYESFLKIGYNEQLVQKIMYYNAYNFFSRF